jgi:copper chaperone CopZ
MDQLVLAIDGMSCGHCVARVRQTLAALSSVHVDDVSIGTAAVTYDASAITPDGIARAVSAAGYPVRSQRAGDASA